MKKLSGLSCPLLMLTPDGRVALCRSRRLARCDGVFQIVKATNSWVWRLNTQTGEICGLYAFSGDNLVCTTSANAADVPKKSYAAIEAERGAQAAEAAAQEATSRARPRSLNSWTEFSRLVRELASNSHRRGHSGS